ncbi:MAG: DUF5121 domain-containing protein [Prevotellaceae bacterium]|nr:DUF5121 domain-containing protein [Prevotellaceae bacterium]
MKKFIQFTIVALLLAACNYENSYIADPLAPVDDQMGLTADPSTIVLAALTGDDIAVTFSWGEAAPRGDSVIYHFRLGVEGKEDIAFVPTTEQNELIQTTRTISFTHRQLNILMESWGIEPSSESQLKAEVSAEMVADVQLMPEVSATLVQATGFITGKNINGIPLQKIDDNTWRVDLTLTKDQLLTIGVMDETSDWWVNPDFFKRLDGATLQFLPIAGRYRIVADYANKYFNAWVMDGNDKATLKEDGSGAIWVYGEGICKPLLKRNNVNDIDGRVGWDPWNAVCLAPIGNGRYQLTGTLGERLFNDGTNMGLKFTAMPDSWDGDIRRPEFTEDCYAKYTGSSAYVHPYIKVDGGDNIHPNAVEYMGQGSTIRFILDASGGPKNIVLDAFGVDANGNEIPLSSDIGVSINSTPMTQSGFSTYKVELNLTQNEMLNIAGIDMSELMTWWIDPDFIDLSQDYPTFKAASTKYRVTANLSAKYFKIEQMSGNNLATMATNGTGALWLIGSGVGKPFVFPKWYAEEALCLAQTGTRVYRISFKAGEPLKTGEGIILKSGETMNTDAINFRVHFQRGWGDSFNATTGTTNRITVTANDWVEAKTGEDCNIQLKAGATFTPGKTYAFTFTMQSSNRRGTLVVTEEN